MANNEWSVIGSLFDFRDICAHKLSVCILLLFGVFVLRLYLLRVRVLGCFANLVRKFGLV